MGVGNTRRQHKARRDSMRWSDEEGRVKYRGERNKSGGKERREQDRFSAHVELERWKERTEKMGKTEQEAERER